MVIVNVADADLIEQVLRHEGRHPVRTDMPHWRSYRELKNKAYGPLSEWVDPSDTHGLLFLRLMSLNNMNFDLAGLVWRRSLYLFSWHNSLWLTYFTPLVYNNILAWSPVKPVQTTPHCACVEQGFTTWAHVNAENTELLATFQIYYISIVWLRCSHNYDFLQFMTL